MPPCACGCGQNVAAATTSGRPRAFIDNAHRQRAYRGRERVRNTPVLAAVNGTNADLFRQVARLHIHDGDLVADVTFGRGSFWTRTDTTRFRLLASDLEPRKADVVATDFRALSYRTGSIDVVVLDPPYAHQPELHATAARQYNGASAAGLLHDGIMDLYREGMAEAGRVLRPGGLLMVKCQPEIESGRPNWSDVEVHDIAIGLGMTALDRFTLVRKRPSSPPARWSRQVHARRNESVLWVFRNARTPQNALRNGAYGGR